MTEQQIETAKRRAWVEIYFHHEGFSDEEVMYFRPLPCENFNMGFDAGVRFALSHQWVSVEERLPDDDQCLYFVADARLNPMGVDCAEYTCETKLFSRNGTVLHPTHWCPIPQLNDAKD